VYLVYKIENKTNGKVYIGKTKRSFQKRWKGHCFDAKAGSDRYFCRAIRKYGEDGFRKIVIMDVPDNSEANWWEKFWIAFYNATNPDFGYNKTEGGDGTAGIETSEKKRQSTIARNKSRKWDDDARSRQRAAWTPEMRQEMSVKLTGKKRTLETCARLSAMWTQQKREKLAESNRNRVVSDETKQKISEAARGRKLAPDHRDQAVAELRRPGHRAAVAAANKKRVWTPEMRANASRKQSARKARKKPG
jgi:group I intron endonuclease